MAAARLSDVEYHRRLVARFWAKVRVGAPDECWPWIGATAGGGYGKLLVGRYPDKYLEPAHRVAYWLVNGPIPEGMKILHECDNPPCCNEAHLFEGTHQDNMDDMRAKGRGYVPVALKGAEHPNAKLTPELAAAIRAGAPFRDVSSIISRTQFYRVQKGEAWNAIPA